MNRVTLEQIEDEIAYTHYLNHIAVGLPNVDKAMQTITICLMIMKNGYVVVGHSACVDPNNFNPDIGKQVARDNCIEQLWAILGYELKTTLHKAKTV